VNTITELAEIRRDAIRALGAPDDAERHEWEMITLVIGEGAAWAAQDDWLPDMTDGDPARFETDPIARDWPEVVAMADRQGLALKDDEPAFDLECDVWVWEFIPA
jgi:hypothetical protein